jgi:hypothetical protein
MDESASHLCDIIINYGPREQVIILVMNTLSYYKLNPRIPIGNYQTEIGRSAVGRFLQTNNETYNKFIPQVKDQLHPNIHHLIDTGDLRVIEQLHDHDIYWKDNQLSMVGLFYLGNTYDFNRSELYNILSVYKHT